MGNDKMKYEDIRHDIKSGDLLLCSGNSFFSKLIQHSTRSIWSHVGFVLYISDAKRLMIMESVEDIGVRTVPLSSYFHDYNGTGKSYNGVVQIRRHRNYTPILTEQLSKKAFDLMTRRYDWMEILRIAWRIYTNKTNDGPIVDNGLYICAEYVYECYKSVGIITPHNKRGFISPADYGKDKNFYTILS